MVTEVVHRAGERFYELRGVLDDLRARHITVTNFCPVLNRFLDRNPEYLPLIDASHPGSWDKSQPAGSASERTSQ